MAAARQRRPKGFRSQAQVLRAGDGSGLRPVDQGSAGKSGLFARGSPSSLNNAIESVKIFI